MITRIDNKAHSYIQDSDRLWCRQVRTTPYKCSSGTDYVTTSRSDRGSEADATVK